MRILFVSPGFPPFVGGGERYAHALSLAWRGHQVTVLTSDAHAERDFWARKTIHSEGLIPILSGPSSARLASLLHDEMARRYSQGLTNAERIPGEEVGRRWNLQGPRRWSSSLGDKVLTRVRAPRTAKMQPGGYAHRQRPETI